MYSDGSNNTNKLSPQEHDESDRYFIGVQIIQINLVLKNPLITDHRYFVVQIIQINLVLKNKGMNLQMFAAFK